MHYISSVANDQVKHVVNLHDKSYRHQHGQFIAQGTRACSELLEQFEPVVIYMTEDYYATPDSKLLSNFSNLVGVSQHVMDKMSSAKQASGILAIFAIPQAKSLPQSGPGLVLSQISDPGNLGTLIRTAAAMNIKEIILIECTDPYSPKVIQSTAGCMTSVNLYQTSWQNLQAHKHLELCALVVTGGQTPNQINLKNKFLVVGNEAHGLSAQQVLACQQALTIPMPGHAESLNAAIAGAIGLYLMIQHN